MLSPGTTLSRESCSRERSRLHEVPRADLASRNWGLSNLETIQKVLYLFLLLIPIRKIIKIGEEGG